MNVTKRWTVQGRDRYFKHTITTTCWPATVTQTRISLCVLVPLPGKSSGFKELLLLVSTSILIFFFVHFLCLFPELLSNCSHMACQESCAVTPGGAVCYCKSGYEIGPDGTKCKGESCPRLTDLCSSNTNRTQQNVKICTSGRQKLSRYYTKHFTFLHWLFSINIFKV